MGSPVTQAAVRGADLVLRVVGAVKTLVTVRLAVVDCHH